MNFLKKLWPTPFKIEKGNIPSFVVQMIIFVVLCAVVGVLMGALSTVPVLSVIFWILGSLAELYSIVGVLLCIFVFLDVLKQ